MIKITTKSILRAATALAFVGGAGLAGAARAQVVASGVTFLAPPAAPSANRDIFPDSQILVRAITADGTTVLAQPFLLSTSPNQSIKNSLSPNIWVWTNGVPRTIVINQPTLPIREQSRIGFSPYDLSGDGRVITGQFGSRVQFPNGSGISSATFFRGAIWSQETGLTLLPDLSATEYINSVPFANMDGTYFAVNSSLLPYLPDGTPNPDVSNFARKAYRYSPTSGYQNLGSLGATVSMFTGAISGAGDIIAGNSTDNAASNIDANGNYINFGAWRWSASSGLSILPDLVASPLNGTVGRSTSVGGISRDGSTIVGVSVGSDGRRQAVYWRGGTITGLGFLPGFPAPSVADDGTSAGAASADGSVIVGYAGTGANDFVGWRWDAATGMQDLNVLARNAAINLNGYILGSAVDISDDGQFITGGASLGTGDASTLLGYVLQITRAAPTTLDTTSRLIVTLTLPGVTQTSIVNQSFSTQVDGLLNGQNVFTRTVADSIIGAGGVTALADARASLQVGSGLRRVVIGAPVLLSNVTTVLSTTNSTVSVATGTSTTTALVNTNGPATVATGNLGTCATAATNGVNPTGCSLPGTATTVNSNVINANVFTNTINTVTPTTTPTVNQLITAKWQVSATAGNQFGTVHALAGVAAFDRGDRLVGQLLGMGGSAPSGANGVTRRAMPMRDASALGGDGSGLTMFGGYFGNWSRIDADASVPVADVKGSTNGFVFGLEKSLGDSGRIGIAVDHGTSDYTVRDATYPETLSLKHTQVALFAGWDSGRLSLNGAAAYGFGTAKTSLTTPTTPATGNRDVKSWSLGAQAGYTVPLGKNASITPQIGIRHVSAKLSRFTEVGGPSPLIGLDQTVTRTRIYAGLEAKAVLDTGGIRITPRLYGRIARDSGDASGTADLVFANAPNGPTLTAFGPGVGRSVAEVGGSLEAEVGGNVKLWVGYDGTFRDGSRSHATKVGVNVAF